MHVRKAFLVLATLLTTVASYDLNEGWESLYRAYKLIEEAVKNDPQLMFKIRQGFFPAMNYRYWQVDGAEAIPFIICITLHDDTQHGTWVKTNTTEEDWFINCRLLMEFLWTNSLVLNHIPGDLLLTMDSTLTPVLYSVIVESTKYRRVRLELIINGSSSVDDLEQALVLFLSKVSHKKQWSLKDANQHKEHVTP